MKLSEYLKKNGMTTKEYFEMQNRQSKGKTTLTDYRRNQKNELTQKVGLDTLETDLTSLGKTVNDIWDGWQTEETMRNTRSSIESMYDRLLSYQDFQKQYGGADLSELTKTYKTVLDDWDNRTTLYGGFKNADAYNVAVKNTKLSEQFKGLSYDEVQAEIKKYKPDSDEYKFLSNYTDYTDLNDFDKALKNTNPTIPVERPEWYSYVKENYDNWTIPKVGQLNEEKTKKTGVISYYTGSDVAAAESEREKYFKEFSGGQTLAEFEKSFKESQINSTYKTLETKKNLRKLETGVYDSYKHLESNADFEEKSKAVASDNLAYKYINGDKATRQQMVADHYTPNWTQYATSNEIPYTQPSQYEKGSYDELTEKEIKLYNYLFNTQGAESAAKYLEGMRTTLNKRATQRATDSIKAEIDGSVGASIVYSLLSVPMNIAGGIASAGDYLTGNTNPYSTNKLASNVATSIRQKVGANIAESTDGFELFGQNIPSFLYQTGMSMGDTLLGGATFGAGYSVIAGSTAFQQKHRELIEAGESQNIALSGALASGMAEVVFEYISIDKLLKIKSIDSLKKALGTALKQGGVEASEEFLTELSNIISDDAIRGESSELNKLRKDLKARGYNEKEINIAIAKQIGGQLGWAAAGGFLSGGVMGGGASAMAYGKMSSIGKGIRERDRTSETLETASLTPEETEAYKAYSEYTKKGINADNIKNAQLGNLYYLSKSESEGTLNSKKSSISDKQKAVETIQRLSVVESENTDAKRKKELNVGESTTITSTGNSANIEGIKLSGDKTTIVTNEGDVSVNDMTLSDHDADLVVKAEGIAKEYGEEMGSLFLTQYDGKTEVDKYATSFNLTMEYAKHNFTQDMMLENKGVLSTSQVQAIYNATVHQQYVEQDNKIKTITEKQGKSQFIQGTFDDSIIDYDGNTTDGSKVNYKNLTPQQRAALNFAKLFSKATGVNIKLTKSDIELGKHKGKNGSYNPETNTIEIDVYAGRIDAKSVEDSIIPTLSHEVTHWMKYKANTIYESIREDVMKTLAKGNAHNLTETELVALEMERIKKNHPDMTVTPEYAIDELVARACEDMLTNSNKARKLLSKMSKTEQNDFIAKVKETFENLMQWVNDLLSVYKSGSAEAQILRNYKDMLKKISKQWDAMLETAIESNQALQNEGIIAEQLVNGISEDGTTIVGRNNLQMSERTYAEGGRDFLINWLSEQEGLTQADKEDILSQTDRIAELMKDIRENNELPDYARWAATDVVKDENGDKVLSVIVKNGDYAMNIDFSQVCKKRVALNAVLNAMVQSGDLNTYVLTETDVADLNAIIKEHEFEIACALCFVDSKRYRVGGWAESFCEGADKKKNGKMVHQYGFNEMVRSLVPKGSKIQIDEFNFTNRDIVGQPTSNLLSEMDDSELDFTLIDEILKNEYKEGSKPTDLYAYAKAIKDNKELRKILNPAEIISSIGLDAIRLENKDLYKLINRHQGTARPKFAHDSVAYTNDVLMASNFTKEKAKYVGGVRCQSFSDFMANMVFDYVQFVSELSSKELTSHSYTKEPLFVRLFGMTGMKINMSLVPKAVQMTPEQEKYFAILNDPNANKRSAEYKNAKRDYDKLTENAGLDENGNYIWEDETFPYDIAMELVDDPRYSANCGTIAVGISDNHIYKLLQDDKISMVIPYHKSGLNHIVAKMRNIDLYKDYTNTQNTRFANGKKLENTPDFDFYGDLYGRDGKEGTHNPKQTAENYLKWCDEHNYIPKFETSINSRKFRDNPNYYKLLVDFRVYDTDGTYKEQQPVKPIYPANEEFKDLILNGVKDKNGKVYGGLKQQQGTSDKLSAESKQIVEEFRNTLKNKYGKDVMAVKNADRDGSTYAPTFYSHMGKTINEIKQDKIGANSVVSYLKGKGVKNEEIKLSGIESFLEGKKSVTKQELQEFVAGSMLQIEETALEDVGDQNNTRWGKYKLDGGANYREILFKIPNSSYSNEMMRGHWGNDAKGILAHARLQDFNLNGKKMLFIEEIQSDWHNAGHKNGYDSNINNDERAEFDELEKTIDTLNEQRETLNEEKGKLDIDYFRGEKMSFDEYSNKSVALIEELDKITTKLNRSINKREKLFSKFKNAVPDAPFADTYHEFVLKRLIRMAAEQGYDLIGWTPANIQSERWSNEFAEGYRIEYDQDMPKFLRKYGKQWGATVGATTLPNGTEVWSMDITDSMRDSVLYEGQVMYSDRDSAYMNAVNNGDMGTAQRMVKDAAKKAGYTQRLFHGTTQFGYTKFEGTEGYSYDEIQYFATDSLETAMTYSADAGVRRISSTQNVDLEAEAKKHASDMASFMSKEMGDDNYINAETVMESVVEDGWGALYRTRRQWLKDVYKSKYSKEYKNRFQKRYKNFDDFESSDKAKQLVEEMRKFMKNTMDAYTTSQSGTYEFYANTNNLFVLDGKGKNWNELEDSRLPENRQYKTREICEWAKAQGYSGVLFKNIIDTGIHGADISAANVYAFFNPREQVKSADPVTYDNDGNIIPLSERFNKKNEDMRYSDREIIGASGTNYGKGVYLDSDKLDNLSEDERVDKVKNHIMKLGGTPFSAYDNNGNEVKIKIAPKTKYINENGKPARANRHLTNFLDNQVKQESLMLIDEVIMTARFKGEEDAEHPHGWLDNNGKNKWEIWTTYILDKKNTIWEAKLKIANSTNGEKILYDVYPIEMVEQVGTMTTSTTEDNISQDDVKSQAEISNTDYAELDNKVVMTTERIDYLIEDSGAGSRVDYANYWITSISPTDFLNMTLTEDLQDHSKFDNYPSEWNDESTVDTYDYIGELKNNMRQTPYLAIDVSTGKVDGHEGRHRMRALEKKGITSVEIRVEFRDEDGRIIKYSPDGKRLQVKDALTIKNQYGTKQTATLNNIIPLNNDYREQILANYGENVASKDAMRYSDRIEESVYDKMGETARLVKENEKLKEDVDRLKERLKIERQVTHGNFFNRNQLDAVAGHIRNIADSNYDKKELVNSINSIYQYIAHSPDLNWEDLYSQCYDVADKVLDKSRPITETNPYYQDIVDDIRKTKISVNEQQIQNAKYRLGNRWRNSFFNKVTISDNGISLDRQWQEWSSMYPNIFDAELSDADQLVELLDIYDSVRQASETVVEYDKEERTRWLAREIYNQYWNVSPIRTTADKYDKQIKKLNFEHRKAMQEFRESRDAKLKEQHKIDKEKAQRLVKNIRERKDREIAEVKQKSKEMMSAYKENAEKKTKIQSITSNALTLNKWLKDNSKDHHINETLKPVVVNLLQAIDFSSKQMLNKNIPTQKDISLYKALQDVKNMFANANNETALSDLTEMYGIDMDEDITKMLDSAFDTLTSLGDNGYILNKMNLDELNTLNKVVKTIKQVVTKLNKFHIANHFKGVTNLSQNSIVYFDKLGQAKVYDPSKLKGRVAKLLNWSNATPYYAFKRFGDGGKVMFEALQDGQDKLAFNIKSIIDYSNKAYTNKEVREWSEEVKSIKVHDMITNKDVTVQITVAQAMSLYCSLKREQAQGHILGDGIRITDITAKKGKVISQAEGVKLSVDDLSALTGILSNRQIQVADKLQEFMNTVCTEWGNEISMARFGYKAFGEPNYFPISSDKNNLAVDDAKEESNSLFRLLNMSFTKSVKEGANNKVEIKNIFDVFAQHSSDMAKYNAFALPILDFYKWYNYTEKGMVDGEKRTVASLKASMEKAFGKDAKEYVTTFLKDINGQYDVSRDTLGKGLFKNAKIAAVGMNLRVVLLQPTSYFRASAVIDNKYLAKALLHKPKVSKATEHCGMALWKSLGYYDTNIQRGVTDQIKHNETWKDKAVEVSMKGAEVADKITWGYLWNACELEIRDTRKDLRVGSQEFYDAISKKLRDVIYATQVVDSTMTRSQMMRSQGMYDKMLTSFASESTLAYNMVVDAFDSARLEKRADGKISGNSVKKIARVVAAYTITNAAAALVESGFDAFRDEDDEEMDLTEFMKLYFTNFAFDMSLTAKIPYVKEFVSIMQGFTSSRTDTQWMQSLGYALKGWFKVLAGDGKPVSALKNSLRSLSYLSGMPFYNAYRDTMALFDKLDVLTAEEIEEWLEDLFS